MTRKEFRACLKKSKYPVACAFDLDVYASAPNIYGRKKEGNLWVVYRNDYRGKIESKVIFQSEEEALDYLAMKMGILPKISLSSIISKLKFEKEDSLFQISQKREKDIKVKKRKK